MPMKKIYALSVIIIPAIVLVFAFTSGPSAGYTGSPLDGIDCTDCHLPGPATSVTGWISTDIPMIGYTPGDTYTITLSTPGATTDKMGFQITCESFDVKTGTWIVTNAQRTKIVGGTAVTHTAAGTDPQGTPNSWTMDWTAPESGTGAVFFYASVNASNNSGTNAGDVIYVTGIEIPESNIGIAENLESKVGKIYPNPAKEKAMIDLPEGSVILIYDNAGHQVMATEASASPTALDVSSLEKGVYYLTVIYDGQQCTRRLLKHE